MGEEPKCAECDGEFGVALDDLPGLAERYGGEMNWQPIETAPKDGTGVLVWQKYYKPCIAEFNAKQGIWYAICDGNLVIEDPGSWSSPQTFVTLEPTHWMPLPEVPI